MKKWMTNDEEIKSSFSVSDIVGDIDPQQLQVFFKMQCGAKPMSVDASTGYFELVDDVTPRVITVDFPTLPASKNDRKSKLAEHDAFLASMLSLLSPEKYTVIYTTTPPSTEQLPSLPELTEYEMDDSFPSAPHTELKRDLSMHDAHNKTADDAPLFEKYQFLTPGLFMGLLVGFLLLSILGVAINAVASLQVSYAAFDKQTGPSSQKKQQ